MSDIAIRCEGLSKRYRIGQRDRYRSLRDTLTDVMSAPFQRLRSASRTSGGDNTVWALKGVSFEVRRGEVVGIIGRNGAGKSTLLKILSRITEPTEGIAEIHGRLGSLLEVGTGFHSELTGRENVFLNGAILGMKKAEIERKFDEILAFAELEKFVDTPVKHYSSGMYVRLAFAVAAHLDPEILLVDEVLAVGDAAFQEKCLGKMGEVSRRGRTVLFVSHNMAAVTALCGRALLLEQGRIEEAGPTKTVVSRFLGDLRMLSSIAIDERSDRQGDGRLRLTGIRLKSGPNESSQVAVSGQDLMLEVEYAARNDAPLTNVVISVGFYGANGQFLLLCSNEMTGTRFERLRPKGRLVCRIPRLPLAPGVYDLNLHCTANGILADWVQYAGRVVVREGDFFGTGRLPPESHGGFLVPHEWSIGE